MKIAIQSQNGEQSIDHAQILLSLRKQSDLMQGNYENLIDLLIQKLTEAENKIKELENNTCIIKDQ